ncbi:MAG: hypothetical protein JWN26_830 [Candidatus Saccharibacteria bacterium]|nr:hypothetical protein [Candidatus Saccharibacteria bacterium]
MNIELPILSFETRAMLRNWLITNHSSSKGIYVRIVKKHHSEAGVTFEEVLDEGLCFGWSENKRLPGDEISYLQRFTPRKSKGTVSSRNLEHVQKLVKEGLMTPGGLEALGNIDLIIA